MGTKLSRPRTAHQKARIRRLVYDTRGKKNETKKLKTAQPATNLCAGEGCLHYGRSTPAAPFTTATAGPFLLTTMRSRLSSTAQALCSQHEPATGPDWLLHFVLFCFAIAPLHYLDTSSTLREIEENTATENVAKTTPSRVQCMPCSFHPLWHNSVSDSLDLRT